MSSATEYLAWCVCDSLILLDWQWYLSGDFLVYISKDILSFLKVCVHVCCVCVCVCMSRLQIGFHPCAHFMPKQTRSLMFVCVSRLQNKLKEKHFSISPSFQPPSSSPSTLPVEISCFTLPLCLSRPSSTPPPPSHPPHTSLFLQDPAKQAQIVFETFSNTSSV